MLVRQPPVWAQWAAWGTVLAVIPSAVWRVSVGLGVDLGWSDEHLRLEQIPGRGTTYVIQLSVLSIGCAAMTFALVRPWGERFPRWIPWLGGRRVWPAVPATVSLAGGLAVAAIVVVSALRWDGVSGFADNPHSPWAKLMIACYAPAALWPILLFAVTGDYIRRHLRA
ncbi:hypothetical protein D5S18_14105 [Nocardia panacis]|uniref:Uncharacterized protein n=1 Tax=Nocardia panacis TaxID=2340916 RepID=A0A3A4K8M6_9NOCA|nr:hypothetical protein [Nocardia panacis]RJO75564.1 hypothetical protein D5S18_14105 [Nocardia panacis]